MAVLRITKQIVLTVRQYYYKVIFSILNKSDFDLIAGNRTGMWIDNYKVKTLRKLGSNIGDHSYIRSYISIIHPKNLVVGDRSKVGRAGELNLYETLTVGDDVEIGSVLIVHTAEQIMSALVKKINAFFIQALQLDSFTLELEASTHAVSSG